MIIENETQLREIYGHPKGRAEKKVLKKLDKHAKNFIDKAPFVVIATTNRAGGMDASPRGGEPGFVKVLNNELIIPDYKGNNRIDSLVNITETGSIGLIFMIPGIGETLRINGKASIITSEKLIKLFPETSKPPISCIVVSISEVFLHCAKAFMRSKLWDSSSQIDPDNFPSMGRMLNDQLKIDGPPETRAEMLKRYKKDL